MSAPLVSICLPNLNHRRFLPERMESICAQTLRDWELVVCDSYSDDGSWEFFQKFKQDRRVHLHQVPREGVYAGWNECLRRARGRYIHIATSDDTARPEFLERLLAPLEQSPDVLLAYSDFTYLDEDGRPLPEEPQREKPKRAFLGEWASTLCRRDGRTEFLLTACFGLPWFTMSAVLFHRDLLAKTGLFRRDRGSQADLEWGLRALLRTDTIFIPDRLATWRVHHAQASSSQSYDWRFLGTLLHCFRSVLRDPTAGVPPQWKTVPDWERHIIGFWRQVYRDRFDLYRGTLRRDPRRFFKGYLAAWRHDPAWAAVQTLRGFPPMASLDDRRCEWARQLIATFHGQWPPHKLAEVCPA